MEFYIQENFKHDVQDMETQASPSFINMKQSDMRIVIDSTIDEASQSSLFNNVENPIEHINEMIEKIKNLTRRKKVHGNVWEYNTCHACRGLLENKVLVRCVEEECSRYFCMRCMNKKYSMSCEEIYNIIQTGKWSCFSCEGLCNCKMYLMKYHRSCFLYLNRCKDRFLEHDMFQLVAFEKSKRKSPKIATNIRTERGGTPRGGTQETSNNKVFKKDENNTGNSNTLKSNNNLESKKMETITTPKETKKILIPLRRSGIRSKILAKKQLRKAQHFLEYSSDDEAEKAEAEGKQATENVRKGNRGAGVKRRQNEECHFCGTVDADTPMAICSVEKCRKGFCESCIYENFQQDFTFKNYNPECWVCYRCAGLCKCSKCSRKRMTGFKIINDDFLNSVDFKRGQNKPIAKRRPKYYDPLTDDEYAIHFHDEQSDKEEDRETTDNKEISENENSEDSGFLKKLVNKRKRLNKGSQIDSSQIISEINIDSACLTLYAAENEDELLTGTGTETGAGKN